MKNALLTTLALLPLTALLPLSPAPAQDPGQDPPTTTPMDPEKGLHAKCKVFYYTVQDGDAYFMTDIAQQIHGRTIPKYSQDGRQINLTDNILVLDDHRILIFDLPERAQKILELLEELDVPEEVEEAVNEAPAYDSEVYVPRYLSPGDILDGLEPFARAIWDEENGSRPNLRLLGTSGRLLMRDTRANLDTMLGLLAELDRPSPQLELTCYVLRGTDEPSDTSLPTALTDNLARLVPFAGFELATMGVLRTSADHAGTGLSMDMQGSNESFSLSARLTAFDDSAEGGGILTIRDCRMYHAGNVASELFKTDTSIVGGEYAVLGATGSTPIFVVLRFERVDF